MTERMQTDNGSDLKNDRVSGDLASAATGRALGIYNQMHTCDETTLSRARKILSDQVETLIEAGESDEQRLVVRALTHLKSIDREHADGVSQVAPV